MRRLTIQSLTIPITKPPQPLHPQIPSPKTLLTAQPKYRISFLQKYNNNYAGRNWMLIIGCVDSTSRSEPGFCTGLLLGVSVWDLLELLIPTYSCFF